eukprot:6996859-Pyramimonas_sp.AAC.1
MASCAAFSARSERRWARSTNARCLARRTSGVLATMIIVIKTEYSCSCASRMLVGRRRTRRGTREASLPTPLPCSGGCACGWPRQQGPSAAAPRPGAHAPALALQGAPRAPPAG